MPAFKNLIILVYVTAVALLKGCDSYPKDPDGTLERARIKGLRVGFAINPPWTSKERSSLSGIEVELLNGFARHIDAKIVWVEGPEGTLMRLLEAGQLDVVIGGITKDTPWGKHVGLTNPFKEEKILACRLDHTSLQSIEGEKVGVTKGSRVAAYVKDKGGKPEPLESLSDYTGVIAATETELESLCSCTDCVEIKREDHVMAVQKGENKFLLTLEKFLDESGF